MRNVFDQYDQPENRLTHALAVCLDEDRALLRDFLRWIGVEPPARFGRLAVIEQSLPGEAPEPEEVADRRGLPDLIVHDGDKWCFLIESKVQARVNEAQLVRHERTLRRRGFEQVHRMALTKAGASPPGTISLTWPRLYEFLGKRNHQDWANRLRSYLRTAEVRMARQGYLTEGTLTMFDGFQFSAENPYTYGEGKRLLKLAMSELRKNRDLKALGVDSGAKGRGAITGRDSNSVWDYLALTDRPRASQFTSWPHLTLAIRSDRLEVAVTIPNGVSAAVRRRLCLLGSQGLLDMNASILKRAREILLRGGWVEAYALQRHYTSQRSQGIVDAQLRFKLETGTGSGRIRRQLEWTDVFAKLLRDKRSNIQFGYDVSLPWSTKGLASRESLTLIVQGWCALEPLLAVSRGHSK